MSYLTLGSGCTASPCAAGRGCCPPRRVHRPPLSRPQLSQPELIDLPLAQQLGAADIAAHGSEAAVASVVHDLFVAGTLAVGFGDKASTQPMRRQPLQPRDRDPDLRCAAAEDLSHRICVWRRRQAGPAGEQLGHDEISAACGNCGALLLTRGKRRERVLGRSGRRPPAAARWQDYRGRSRSRAAARLGGARAPCPPPECGKGRN